MDILPPTESLYSFPNGPLQGQGAPTFRSVIQDPLRNLAQRSNARLSQLKETGFVRKNAQLMVIAVFGVVFYTLCVIRISKNKQIPIALGLITTAFLLYFVQKYHQAVPITDVAVAGWTFAAFLFAAIGSMSYWINEVK